MRRLDSGTAGRGPAGAARAAQAAKRRRNPEPSRTDRAATEWGAPRSIFQPPALTKHPGAAYTPPQKPVAKRKWGSQKIGRDIVFDAKGKRIPKGAKRRTEPVSTPYTRSLGRVLGFDLEHQQKNVLFESRDGRHFIGGHRARAQQAAAAASSRAHTGGARILYPGYERDPHRMYPGTRRLTAPPATDYVAPWRTLDRTIGSLASLAGAETVGPSRWPGNILRNLGIKTGLPVDKLRKEITPRELRILRRGGKLSDERMRELTTPSIGVLPFQPGSVIGKGVHTELTAAKEVRKAGKATKAAISSELRGNAVRNAYHAHVDEWVAHNPSSRFATGRAIKRKFDRHVTAAANQSGRTVDEVLSSGYGTKPPHSFDEATTTARLNVRRKVAANRRAYEPPAQLTDATGKEIVGVDGTHLLKPRTTAEQLSAVQHHLTPKLTREWKEFYRQVWPEFHHVFGDDPNKAIAWFLSQKNAGPGRGVLDLTRILERQAGKEIAVPKIGVAVPEMEAALRGEPVSRGAGAKISDFLDSGFGKLVRTIMGDDPEGGGPFVVDRWSHRSVGHLDESGKRALERMGYDPSNLTSQELTDALYEYGNIQGNELTDLFNRKRVGGRTDWTYDEVQALDWAATQMNWGVTPEHITDAFDINRRTLLAAKGDPEALAAIVREEAGNVLPDSAGRRLEVVASPEAHARIAQRVADMSDRRVLMLRKDSSKGSLGYVSLRGEGDMTAVAREVAQAIRRIGDAHITDGSVELVSRRGLFSPEEVKQVEAIAARHGVQVEKIGNAERKVFRGQGAGDNLGRGADEGGAAGRTGTGRVPPAETTDYQAFLDAVRANSRAWNLSGNTAEELAGKRVFLSEDQKVGYAISPEGDLQNVFNNSGVAGAGSEAVLDAIRNGARTLDAYDGYLPDLYERLGMVEVGRMRFSDEAAPANWDYARGRPDIVFMGLAAEAPEKTRWFTSWDKGKQAALDASEVLPTPTRAPRRGVEPGLGSGPLMGREGGGEHGLIPEAYQRVRGVFSKSLENGAKPHEATEVARIEAEIAKVNADPASWASENVYTDEAARKINALTRDGEKALKRTGLPAEVAGGGAPPRKPPSQSLWEAGAGDPRAPEPRRIVSEGEAAANRERVAKAMPHAQRVRRAQEQGYSEEWAKRTEAATKAFDAAGGGEAGAEAMFKELEGAMPKLQLGNLTDTFDQAAVDQLINDAWNHPDLMFFEKVRTTKALQRVIAGKVPQRNEIRLLDRVYGVDKTQELLSAVPWTKKAGRIAAEIWNIPRSVAASFDLSAPFRQGFVALTRHPEIGFRNFKDMMKAAGSPNLYDDVMKEVMSRRNFREGLYEKAKLSLADVGDISSEEQYMFADLTEKLTGGQRFSPIAASSRAYTAYLNKTRADVFDKLLAAAEAQGRSLEGKEGEKLLKDLGKFVNTATGRGGAGDTIEKITPALNSVLFSPRLMYSRIQTLNPVYYYRLDPFVRKQALQSLATTAIAGGAVLGLLGLAGFKIGFDPRNPDFLKARKGRTRIDPLAGFSQYLRGLSQFATGTAVDPVTGEQKHRKRSFVVSRFFESKANPSAGLVAHAAMERNYAFQPFHFWNELADAVTPMMGADAAQVFADYGLAYAALAYGVGGLGVGIQSYGDRPASTNGGGGPPPAGGAPPIGAQSGAPPLGGAPRFP